MADIPDEPDHLIAECVDVLALGFPYDDTEENKEAWFSSLRATIEARAPIMSARLRRLLRD